MREFIAALILYSINALVSLVVISLLLYNYKTVLLVGIPVASFFAIGRVIAWAMDTLYEE